MSLKPPYKTDLNFPENFVERIDIPKIVEDFFDNKLNEKILVLHGASGFGKTTIAKSLIKKYREKFAQGVIWMESSKESFPKQVKNIAIEHEQQNELSLIVTDTHAAQFFSKQVLKNYRVLVVVDDLRKANYFSLLPTSKVNVKFVITTIKKDTVRSTNAVYVPVEEMGQNESIRLLTYGLEVNDQDKKELQIRKFIDKIGRWPLLLNLINKAWSHLNRDYSKGDVKKSFSFISEKFKEGGLTAFDDNDDNTPRNLAVKLSIETNLDFLSPFEKTLYNKLATILRNGEITDKTIQLFYEDGNKEYQSTNLIINLVDLGLVKTIHTDKLESKYSIILNDVFINYFQVKNAEFKVDYHTEFINLVQKEIKDKNITLWQLDQYTLNNCIYHLIEATQIDLAFSIIFNIGFVSQKIFELGTYSYDDDLDLILISKIDKDRLNEVKLIKKRFSNSIHILNRCSNVNEVVSALCSRVFFNKEYKLENTKYFNVKHNLPDLPSTELERTLIGHDGRIYGCDFSDNGQFIASVGEDKKIVLWNSESGRMIYEFYSHTNRIFCCKISPCNNFLISAGSDYKLKMHVFGDVIETFDMDIEHKGSIWSCDISACSNFAITASEDGRIGIWDLQLKRNIDFLTHHDTPVTGCTFILNDKFIVSSGHDNKVKVWQKNDRGKYTFFKSFKGHNAAVWHCKGDDEGNIISSSIDCNLRVRNIFNDKINHNYIGHTGPVWGCDISQDGRYGFSVSEDLEVKIWDIKDKVLVKTLISHTQYVWGCKFNNMTNKLITCSLDGTIKLWDLNKIIS